MSTIDREDFLKLLKVASVGLTKREVLEQSTAYVFDGGDIITFSGEILTRIKCPIELQGAVPAEELHKMLAKFPDPEVDICRHLGELRIKGKRRAAGITMQKQIGLPYKDVPPPGKWKKAPDKLAGVVNQAARCCGTDETKPMTTVVRIVPELVEACDSFRMFRYEMETGLQKEVLVPAVSLAAISGYTIRAVSYHKGWLHLKLGDHVVSVRCLKGEYPDLGKLLKLENPQKVTLPSNLDDILSRAEVMQDTAFDASVDVNIESGKITLTAKKDGGWFKESKKVEYDGDPLRFSVHPKFLMEVFAKKKNVLVAGNRMKLKVKEATFVICLQIDKQGGDE